jgi:hypothetical protein
MELRRKRRNDPSNFDSSEVGTVKHGTAKLCRVLVIELFEYTAEMPMLFLLSTTQ